MTSTIRPSPLESLLSSRAPKEISPIRDLVFCCLSIKDLAQSAGTNLAFQRTYNARPLSFISAKHIIASIYTHLRLDPPITWAHWIENHFPPKIKAESASTTLIAKEIAKRFSRLESLDLQNTSIGNVHLVCLLFAQCRSLRTVHISDFCISPEKRDLSIPPSLQSLLPHAKIETHPLFIGERKPEYPLIGYKPPEGPNASELHAQAEKHIDRSSYLFFRNPNASQRNWLIRAIAIVALAALVFYIMCDKNPEIMNFLACHQKEAIVIASGIGFLGLVYGLIKHYNL